MWKKKKKRWIDDVSVKNKFSPWYFGFPLTWRVWHVFCVFSLCVSPSSPPRINIIKHFTNVGSASENVRKQQKWQSVWVTEGVTWVMWMAPFWRIANVTTHVVYVQKWLINVWILFFLLKSFSVHMKIIFNFSLTLLNLFPFLWKKVKAKARKKLKKRTSKIKKKKKKKKKINIFNQLLSQ